jgi:hypothetical protein
VLKGRGRFQKRRVDGALEICSGSTDDTRLRRWIHESHTVLPRLRAIVKNGARAPETLYLVVEDLRRRVEELEDELARLRADRANPRC